MGAKDERRKYVRIREEDIFICEPLTMSSLEGISRERVRTITKNVSAGGLLFESDKVFEVGDVLKIQLDIPGWEKCKSAFIRPDERPGRKPLVVVGQVVRIEETGPKSFDVGVAFLALDDRHQAALEKLVRQRSVEK